MSDANADWRHIPIDERTGKLRAAFRAHRHIGGAVLACYWLDDEDGAFWSWECTIGDFWSGYQMPAGRDRRTPPPAPFAWANGHITRKATR